MIKNLDGMFETPDFKPNTHLCIYNNDIEEDYPLHWHSPMEILMPIENSYKMHVDDEEYDVKPYEILFIGSGVIHSCTAPKTGRRYIFQIDLSRIKEITGINHILSFIGNATLIKPDNFPTLHRELTKLFEEICTEYYSSEDFIIPEPLEQSFDESISRGSLCEPIIYSKFLNMLTLIGRNRLEQIDSDMGNQSKKKEYIGKFMTVCHYLDDHFAEELDLETIASMAGFSKYHFSRLFKQFANVSFYKYVNIQRINHAKELLANPHLTITQVAIQSGFSSTTAFIRMFKQFQNCTPSEFRNIRETISFRGSYALPLTISDESINDENYND